MVVSVRLGDAEVQRDDIEEWRLRQRDARRTEIVRDMEAKLEAPGAERLPRKDRLVGSTIGIGAEVSAVPPAAIGAGFEKFDPHAGGWSAAGGIEHMR